MHDTVVTVSCSRAVTAVAERVTVTSVGAAVGTVPVWETLASASSHLGVIGTGRAVSRGRWVVSASTGVACQVTLDCAVFSGPAGNTFAFLTVIMPYPLSAVDAGDAIFGSRAVASVTSADGVAYNVCLCKDKQKW